MTLARRIGRLLNMDFDYVAHGGAYLAVDHAVNVGTSIITTVVLTNVLPKELYGSYAYLIGIFLLVLPLTLPGMSSAMIRSVSRGKEGTYRQGTRLRVLGGIAGTVSLAGVAAVFVGTDRSEQAFVLVALCVLYPLAFAADDYKTFFHARREFKTYAVVNGLVNVTVAGSTVAAALTVPRLLPVLGANIGARALCNAVAFFVADRRRVNADADGDFARDGRNLSFVAAVNNISFTIDQVLVGSLFTMEIMASYALATRLSEPFRFLGVLINRLAWPKAVKMRGSDAAGKFTSKFYLLVLGAAALTLLSFAVIPPVMRWLFPMYTDAVGLSLLMIVSALVSVLVTYLETYFISQDHLQRFYYFASTARPTATIVLMYPFIHWWGFVGAVYARLVVRAAATLVLLWRMIAEGRRLRAEERTA
ncbi:MAG: oligosaccharide flippase family protein [Deltaproteobacteria bacterium]|nr:oligosaccharide flippase family protein [Deltaproteobacteria bacterium]